MTMLRIYKNIKTWFNNFIPHTTNKRRKIIEEQNEFNIAMNNMLELLYEKSPNIKNGAKYERLYFNINAYKKMDSTLQDKSIKMTPIHEETVSQKKTIQSTFKMLKQIEMRAARISLLRQRHEMELEYQQMCKKRPKHRLTGAK